MIIYLISPDTDHCACALRRPWRRWSCLLARSHLAAANFCSSTVLSPGKGFYFAREDCSKQCCGSWPNLDSDPGLRYIILSIYNKDNGIKNNFREQVSKFFYLFIYLTVRKWKQQKIFVVVENLWVLTLCKSWISL